MGGIAGKLGRYQIVKHLASGGMADVLLARAIGIEGFTRHVVIKRIRPSQAKDQTFVQMFLNEARLAAQLHHANIVQVHDIGQEGNEYFFAMEYVHGEDLRRLLQQLVRRREKIPIDHAVTIISAAAVALHHAHEQRGPDRKPLGLVHRDVTPANILVGYDGNVKVVDFGIAKAVARSTEDTQAGTLKGKASYMAPEQCTGSAVDRRSDVFALGIVLYELITARRLFKADNDFLTMSAIVAGKVPPPKTYRPDIPAELESIIAKALAVEPEQRYQTADEMRDALERFAINTKLRTSSSALAAYMKQQFGNRPEPWLIEDDVVELELDADFDGTASGLAPPPAEALEALAIPQTVPASKSSPIMKARKRAGSSVPPMGAPIALLPNLGNGKSATRPPAAPLRAASGASAEATALPERGIALPVEIASHAEQSEPALPPSWPLGSTTIESPGLLKRLFGSPVRIVIGLCVAALIAAAVMFAMKRDLSEIVPSTNEPPVAAPAKPVGEPEPAPTPVETEPAPAAPAAAAEPEPSPEPEKRSKSSKRSAKTTKPEVKRKKTTWDPDSLFPSKK